MEVSDISAIAQVAHAHGIVVALDNTWSAGIAFKPFLHGIDISMQALTNASGFNGADGVFRFRADGLNERGLAVMEIDNNAAVVISPAPRSFAGG